MSAHPFDPWRGTSVRKSVLPMPADVYANPLAPNLVVAYWQTAGGLHRMFPACPVDLQSGRYTVFSRGDALRNQTAPRAPTTGRIQIGVGVDTTPTYSCDVYSAEYPMSPELAANWSVPFMRDQAAYNALARAAYLTRERNFIADCFTTSIWATDATPSTLWSDPGSDPIGDIETGKRAIKLASGFDANVFGIGYDVWKALKQHPDVLARVGLTGTSSTEYRKVMLRLFADLIEVDEVIVGDTVYNTASPGASVSMAFTAGKHGLLAHRATAPSIIEPSAGYRFTWRGLTGSPDGLRTRQGVDPRSLEQWYQIEHAEDNKVTASELGYFFNGAVA